MTSLTESEILRHLSNLIENAESSISEDQLRNVTQKIMHSLVEKYKSNQTGTSKMPSAPNTSKYVSTQYGDISYKQNVSTSGGTYGFDRFYPDFLKIGSSVTSDVRSQLKQEFETEWEKLTGIALTGKAVVTSDGSKFYFSNVSGTAWGGFGFYQSR